MKNKLDNWMEKLVRNYQLPEETKSETPKKMLTDFQKKIILGKK
jgi:hypothetical protein